MPHVDIGDVKLYFEIYGNELELCGERVVQKPTLIFLHGGPGTTDHTMYVDFWSRLSSCAQVIFIDQRGNGRSDRGEPSLWTLEQCGKDIHLFCNKLGIVKPFVAGVSWGGYVAMSYASLFPQDPCGLIFCNTEAKFSAQARERAFRNIVGEQAAQAVRSFDDNPIDPIAVEKYIKHCLPNFSKNSYNQVEIGRCIKNMAMREKFLKEENATFNFLPTLHRIACSTLIIAGDADPAHPLECAKETAKEISADFVELSVISGGGAPVYKDRPEQTLEVIYRFIKKTWGNYIEEYEK